MAFENPTSVLFDTEGRELNVSQSQTVTTTQPGLVVYGSGSTGWETLKLSSNGELFVTGTVDVTVGEVDQGAAGTIAESWYMRITDGTQVIGTGSSAPIFISGAVDIPNTVTVTTADGDVIDVALTNTASVEVVNTASITGSVTVNSIGAPVTVRRIDAPNTLVTGVNATTSSFTALSANANRTTATFYMDGNTVAFLKLGSGAAQTDFTVKMNNNSYFELPDHYTGQVDVVFDKEKAGDTLRITEVTE